ncbi:DUF1835 domain-containing protein [Breoghania sp. L-A4]|uniref:DUF1835 domain-containing protein n=1 Tax=Breoghania sp. L-A4 TaxID=2304600 RepID=UPI000E359373|nr:DUF1835 domain-containing protein [Breoghania sp. L-A4]AXS39046.1 DUF1835 domain-containing protein [Breoghania sp. L-A4]
MSENPVLSDDERPLSLPQQKKQAKELRDGMRAGTPAALDRFRRHHPKASELAPADMPERFSALADAQLVIARELGVQSWPRLVHHIARMDDARRAIARNAPAPDGARATLHVRCGSDIREGLRAAGFSGEFLEYSDPLCQGPLVRPANDLDPVYFDLRATFIDTHDIGPGPGWQQVRASMIDQQQRLMAAGSFDEIVLWFEHDSYDQLLLARALDVLGRHAGDTPVSIVSLDSFPGIERFNGLGHLSPVALRRIFSDRQPVTAPMVAAGTAVWETLCGPSPLPLHAIATRRALPGLPYMARALIRHLSELPGSRDGLSLTERLTLDILRDGPKRGGHIFRALVLEREPLTFLGDLMFWSILAGLLDADDPALEVIDGGRNDPASATFALTAIGEALAIGMRDFGCCGPVARWVGGTRCFSDPDWRWDPVQQIPVAIPARL